MVGRTDGEISLLSMGDGVREEGKSVKERAGDKAMEAGRRRRLVSGRGRGRGLDLWGGQGCVVNKGQREVKVWFGGCKKQSVGGRQKQT